MMKLRVSQRLEHHKTHVSASIGKLVLFTLCCALLFAGCSSTTINTTSIKHPRVLTTEKIDDPNLAKAQQIMKGMTLQQKLGQLLLVEYSSSDYINSGLQQMVKDQYVGGILYQPGDTANANFDYPVDTATAIKAFSDQAQSDAKIPLLVAIDQEGGDVAKVSTIFTPSIGAQDMGASGDPNIAAQQGKQDAQWLSELGINTNLAPVVDVNTNPSDPLLVGRMFGTDPQTVIKYAGPFLNALQQNKIMGTLKHFPGLGSLPSQNADGSSNDPHDGLPVVNRSLPDLMNIDLAPYKTLIQQDNPAMIMSTDVVDTAIDPKLPAELSPKAINGLLRTTLGYNGVVITDGIYMNGITNTWTTAQATTMAIEAGCDIVEGLYKPEQVADAIASMQTAIQNGQLTQARVDQSVQRILLMKIKYGLIK
jgi:beta-N-acetylhexosaminidase